MEAAVNSPARHVTWISFTRNLTDILLQKAVDVRPDLRGSHLITLMPPRAESIPALLGLFHPVFGLVEGFQWLPKLELVEVVTRDDASDRFIGGSVDSKAKTLTLLRGNIEVMVGTVFPFCKIGGRDGSGFRPGFGLSDFGRTIVLGDYEASADAILYELDPRLPAQAQEMPGRANGLSGPR